MLSIQSHLNTQIELNERSPLYAILRLLDQEQEGDIELSLEDHAIISDLLKTKVDSCALFMLELESESDRLKKIAKSFSEAAKTVEKKMERFEKYVLYVLQANSIQRLAGEAFEVKNTLGREKVSLKADLTPELEMEYPDFVRVKTEWNVADIKEALKDGVDLPFATLEREAQAKFSIKKGSKK